jgi:hypothetical protein
MDPLIAYVNVHERMSISHTNPKITMKYSTVEGYLKAVKSHNPDLKVISHDFFPYQHADNPT